MGLALAFSGGGFRATLFHLGVIEYLSASGRLRDVKVITSTSGGSILAAHLVCRWDDYCSDATSFSKAADELTRFVGLDVRGHVVRRTPWIWAAQVIPRRLFPSGKPTAIRTLMAFYDAHLFHGALLSDLPASPRLGIASTNLSAASLTLFSQASVEHVPLDGSHSAVAVEARLASASLAVAASSAFPAFFPPMLVTPDDIGAQEGTADTWLTDGGVTDNLALKALDHLVGVEPLELVVSDAGRSFEPSTTRQFGFIGTALRSTDLMMFRIRQMELLPLRSRADVHLISIADSVVLPGAAPEPVQQQLESIRTDLDAFSRAEIAELRRHGYWCALKTLGEAQGATVQRRVNDPVPKAVLAKSLRESRHRRLVRSVFAASDWVSWLNLATVVATMALAIAVAPWIRDSFLRGYRELVRAPVPSYERGSSPQEQVVDQVERATNSGFHVEREDRVWDLRRLQLSTASGSAIVTGPAVMTRSITLSRVDQDAHSYGFFFETSGRTFQAWSLNKEYPLTLRTQEKLIVNGPSLLKPWDLRIDVSREPPAKPFQLRIQSEVVDAFKDKNNWWTGMAVVSDMDVASMRIIFPEGLPFRDPAFLSYPSGSASEAVSFAGIAITALSEHELLWTVNKPVKNYTYRVNWRW